MRNFVSWDLLIKFYTDNDKLEVCCIKHRSNCGKVRIRLLFVRSDAKLMIHLQCELGIKAIK